MKTKSLLTFWAVFVLNIARGQDTIYIKKEPVHIPKQVYYAKPKDTTYLHNKVGVNLALGQKAGSNYTSIAYPDAKIGFSNPIDLNLEYSRLAKKIEFGSGLGFRQENLSIEQTSRGAGSVDSVLLFDIVKSTITDTLFGAIVYDSLTKSFDTAYYDSSYTRLDTAYYTQLDTIFGQNIQNQGVLRAYYIAIPISLAYNWERKKFGLHIRQSITSYLSISQKNKSVLAQKDAFKKTNTWDNLLKKSFFVLATDVRISYKVYRNNRFFVNYSPRIYINTPYKNIQTSAFQHSFGAGFFTLF